MRWTRSLGSAATSSRSCCRRRCCRRRAHRAETPPRAGASVHDRQPGADAVGSIGISVFPHHGDEPALLLRRADIAMYVAKRTASGHAAYAPEHDLHSPARPRSSVAASGHRRRELVLHSADHHDGDRRRLIEALVRWQHSTRGFIPPGDYRRGGAHGAHQTAHRLSCGRRSSRPARGGAAPRAPIAVNLSMRNLLDPDLPRQIEALLREAGVGPRAVSASRSPRAARWRSRADHRRARALEQHGVVAAIDDFGTGYPARVPP